MESLTGNPEMAIPVDKPEGESMWGSSELLR